MNPRLFDAALKRKRLIERCGAQRQRLAETSSGLKRVCAGGDRVIAGAHKLRENPQWVLAATAVLVALKPRRVWRLAKTGFVLWRIWNTLRRKLPPLAAR